MNSGSIPWVEKYRPSNPGEFIGHKDKLSQLIRWIKSWSPKKAQKALVIFGPPGIGKTSMVYVAAKSLGYEVVEFNASDTRNKESILSTVLESALTQSFWNEHRVILLDEIDGLSGSLDRGGFKSLKELVEKTQHPIIFTANELDRSQTKFLGKFSLIIELAPLSKSNVVEILKRICNAEHIDVSDEILENIANRSNGDLRAAINDLQSLIIHDSFVDRDTFREQQLTLEDAIKNLLSLKEISEFKALNLDTDPDTTLLLLYENSLLNGMSLEDALVVIKNISLADLYLQNISENMNWNLLKYIYEFLVLALMRSNKYPHKKIITESEWPLLVYIGRRKSDKDLLNKQLIADKLHLSLNEVNSLYALFKIILTKIPKKQIADWLNVDEKQITIT